MKVKSVDIKMHSQFLGEFVLGELIDDWFHTFVFRRKDECIDVVSKFYVKFLASYQYSSSLPTPDEFVSILSNRRNWYKLELSKKYLIFVLFMYFCKWVYGISYYCDFAGGYADFIHNDDVISACDYLVNMYSDMIQTATGDNAVIYKRCIEVIGSTKDVAMFYKYLRGVAKYEYL